MHFSLGDACKRIKEQIQSKLYFLKISNAQLYFGTMLLYMKVQYQKY